MNKFTILQLQQMRESEDHVEFKTDERGSLSYDGHGKTNPRERCRCILGYAIALYCTIDHTIINCAINTQTSEGLRISLRTTKSDLYALRDRNLIQYVGSNKTRHWGIINKG